MKTTRNKLPKKKVVKKKKTKLNFTTLDKKYKSGIKLFQYEEKYLEKKLIEQDDTLWSKIVRHKTCCGGVAPCTSLDSCSSCRKTISFKTCHACHVIDRGWYSHRWDLRNGYACCPLCNNPMFNAMDHKMMLVAQVDKDYGAGTFNSMREVRNKIKPTIAELYEIKSYLQSVLDTLPEHRKG